MRHTLRKSHPWVLTFIFKKSSMIDLKLVLYRGHNRVLVCIPTAYEPPLSLRTTYLLSIDVARDALGGSRQEKVRKREFLVYIFWLILLVSWYGIENKSGSALAGYSENSTEVTLVEKLRVSLGHAWAPSVVQCLDSDKPGKRGISRCLSGDQNKNILTNWVLIG